MNNITFKIINNYLKKYKMDFDRIKKQIKIYTSRKGEIFIHSKNIIFDHNKMLIGSTNIYPRSFEPKKDLELSIYLKGPKVKEIEDKILQQYENIIFKRKFSKNKIPRYYIYK